MKITLKTLKGQQLPLDVETTMTVSTIDRLDTIIRFNQARHLQYVYVTNGCICFLLLGRSPQVTNPDHTWTASRDSKVDRLW